MQRIVFIVVALVAIALVAYVYLSIGAATATAALQIRMLRSDIHYQQLDMAQMQNTIAELNTKSVMAQRAGEMGYEPFNPDRVVYLVIPGYKGRNTVALASPPAGGTIRPPILKPSYTQSLWEWFVENMVRESGSAGGAE